jgi:cytochrome c oxidase assembly protein subunit 15
MLLALLIVALLIYILARSQKSHWRITNTELLPTKFKTVLIVAMGMTLVQVMMGTQVREAVDLIANHHAYIDRKFWRDDFPVIFYVHRSFSSVILFTNAWLVWQIIKTCDKTEWLVKVAWLWISLIVTAILAGIALDRLGVPPVAQPIHLLMANLIFGTQFFVFIYLQYSLNQAGISQTDVNS